MECRGPSDLWIPCFNPRIEHNLDEMRERGKGWGRPGSHPRATSGEGPSSGIPEYDPVIRFMTWPSPFGHPQLAPATPASGGLGRESPSYTGKSRHRRQEQSPASAWTHPVPIPPSPSSPKTSSPQCTTEMPKGRRPSSAGGGGGGLCLHRQGQYRPQKLGAGCRVAPPRDGQLGPTQHLG